MSEYTYERLDLGDIWDANITGGARKAREAVTVIRDRLGVPVPEMRFWRDTCGGCSIVGPGRLNSRKERKD
jgi:hypothetical protein